MTSFFDNLTKKTDNDTAKGTLLNLVAKTTPNKSLCPSLSLKTRIYGWSICMFIGFFVSMLSSGLLKSLMKGEYGIIKFAIFYVVGTVLTFASSMFLWGPTS